MKQIRKMIIEVWWRRRMWLEKDELRERSKRKSIMEGSIKHVYLGTWQVAFQGPLVSLFRNIQINKLKTLNKKDNIKCKKGT